MKQSLHMTTEEVEECASECSDLVGARVPLTEDEYNEIRDGVLTVLDDILTSRG
jgi:hypothetical protein